MFGAAALALIALHLATNGTLRFHTDELYYVVVAAAALQLVTFAQLVLPITPPSRIHAMGLDSKNELFADCVGWEGIPHQVSSIYESQPPADRSGSVIISAYCGVPGAIDIYGSPSPLPPVVSPQLSDYYWLPSDLAASSALMVDHQPSVGLDVRLARAGRKSHCSVHRDGLAPTPQLLIRSRPLNR